MKKKQRGPGAAAPASLANALIQTTQTLKTAGIENPRREARLLAAHHLDLDPTSLVLRDHEPLADPTGFAALVARRAAHEPLAYITGTKGFYKHDFIVTPATLIPRPETELLVEQAIAANPARILDLGTGSGCILLSILADCPAATGLGTDISNDALACARRNATALGLSERALFQQSDWTQGITGRFDVILSNPPYITSEEYSDLDATVRDFEPETALTSGTDGLDAYRAIVSQTPALLTDGGRLILEIGASQGRAVRDLLDATGFDAVITMTDLAGLDRCVQGVWRG